MDVEMIKIETEQRDKESEDGRRNNWSEGWKMEYRDEGVTKDRGWRTEGWSDKGCLLQDKEHGIDAKASWSLKGNQNKGTNKRLKWYMTLPLVMEYLFDSGPVLQF